MTVKSLRDEIAFRVFADIWRHARPRYDDRQIEAMWASTYFDEYKGRAFRLADEIIAVTEILGVRPRALNRAPPSPAPAPR